VRQRIAAHVARRRNASRPIASASAPRKQARAEQRAAAARLEEQRLADAKARADQAEADRRTRAIADATSKPNGPGSSPYAPLPPATLPPAGIIERGESAAGKALVNAMAPPPAPRADEPATLKLGTICQRLGAGADHGRWPRGAGHPPLGHRRRRTSVPGERLPADLRGDRQLRPARGGARPPSGGMNAETVGKLPAQGMSTSLLVAAHAMQGLIAGSVARNGVSALQDEDAQGELTQLAMVLGDRLIETVEIARVREINDWRYERAGKLEKQLRAVLEVIGKRERKDAGEVPSRAVYESILENARQALEDDEIPF
jgi:hypothetical protein